MTLGLAGPPGALPSKFLPLIVMRLRVPWADTQDAAKRGTRRMVENFIVKQEERSPSEKS